MNKKIEMLAIVMAGGDGKRLSPLTQDRAKPAVPFGGIYRLIDITLSNCINSGLRQILVLTQYKADSLNRHIQFGWNIFSADFQEFIWNLPPQKRVGDSWYLGTADSIYQNLWTIQDLDPEYIVVLSGDHIYKMDYYKMLDFHKENDADVTIAAIECPLNEASDFGVLKVNNESRIVDFEEKPEKPSPIPGKPGRAFASMGIYIFPARKLYDYLNEFPGGGKGSDFGKNILPAMVENEERVFGWTFDDENKKPDIGPYWRDVGTIKALYDANMDLIQVEPIFNLYDPDWKIRTMPKLLPPAKFLFAQSKDEGGRKGIGLDSIVGAGSIISGGQVNRSVLSPEVRVNSFASIEESILFDEVEIGRHCKIRKAIIDKYVKIPAGVEIGYDMEKDKKQFVVTEDGIVIVARGQKVERL